MHQFSFKFLVTFAASGLFAVIGQANLAEFNAINAAARAARERGDQAAYLANVRKLGAFTPGHPSIQVALARGLALDGDGAGAVAQLNRMADLGLSFAASGDAAFQSLKDDPGFVAAAKRLAENGKGTGRGKGIIKLGLTGGSEGVAWSEASKAFLMGSSGSIHAYKLNGEGATKTIAKAGGSQILRRAVPIWFALTRRMAAIRRSFAMTNRAARSRTPTKCRCRTRSATTSPCSRTAASP